jgi:hypothetical protein
MMAKSDQYLDSDPHFLAPWIRIHIEAKSVQYPDPDRHLVGSLDPDPH